MRWQAGRQLGVPGRPSTVQAAAHGPHPAASSLSAARHSRCLQGMMRQFAGRKALWDAAVDCMAQLDALMSLVGPRWSARVACAPGGGWWWRGGCARGQQPPWPGLLGPCGWGDSAPPAGVPPPRRRWRRPAAAAPCAGPSSCPGAPRVSATGQQGRHARFFFFSAWRSLKSQMAQPSHQPIKRVTPSLPSLRSPPRPDGGAPVFRATALRHPAGVAGRDGTFVPNDITLGGAEAPPFGAHRWVACGRWAGGSGPAA